MQKRAEHKAAQILFGCVFSLISGRDCHGRHGRPNPAGGGRGEVSKLIANPGSRGTQFAPWQALWLKGVQVMVVRSELYIALVNGVPFREGFGSRQTERTTWFIRAINGGVAVPAPPVQFPLG
jgi:hypothetical protein